MSDQAHTGARAAPDSARPWDPEVRMTYWTLAAEVLANGLLTKPGGMIHIRRPGSRLNPLAPPWARV
ncbi:hypothetical protein SAMN04488047_101471 [Tranquillimonas alkanivorans]|uniref:Uncharacterized protein n=1 Tax=Tranquillimonas alkanivorans TaxID=441119 RepID=A0A1I5L6D7_9RHOB|nr:hypothetical protein SAMN04488047_101471 [Tranquillimonas alkanivorans]